ncbi:MAG TPA: hypothetical protein VGA03_03710 [Anaerolineales bacterium]
MSSEITQMLDQLANFQAQRDVLNIQKRELIDQILTEEIKARLEEIEAEFGTRMEAVEENIALMEEEIKAEVINHGATVKGTFLRAVWNRGRVSWDTRGIERYAQSHPEVLGFRKQGMPYVSITKIQI